MSCYDCESGHFKLSCREYRAFLKKFRDGWNKALDEAYALAKRVRADVLKINKGKRGVVWARAVGDCIIDTHSFLYGPPIQTRLESHEHSDLIIRALGCAWGGENKKPRSPQKKFFKHVTNKIRQFTAEHGEVEIGFDDKSRTVRWYVHENNHACERARNSAAGKLFFKLLGEVQWTRGTGGSIVGNDEYNRHDNGGGVGAGGNYLKEAYGPKGTKDKKYEMRMAHSY